MSFLPQHYTENQCPTAEPAEDGPNHLLVIGYLSGRPIALPALSSQRILPMAAFTPIPGVPESVVGVLDLEGILLPVVNPRPALRLATPAPHPSHQLVLLTAITTYLLWLDEVEQIISVSAQSIGAVESDDASGVVPLVLRLGGHVVPILSPERLDPGPVIRHGWTGMS